MIKNDIFVGVDALYLCAYYLDQNHEKKWKHRKATGCITMHTIIYCPIKMLSITTEEGEKIPNIYRRLTWYFFILKKNVVRQIYKALVTLIFGDLTNIYMKCSYLAMLST